MRMWYRQEYSITGTKGHIVHWNGKDYTLDEDVTYAIDENRMRECGRDPEMYFVVSAHAIATNNDEVNWSFDTLQDLMDWADAGDLQKNLDGVIHCDDD
jgi:hypothetical protein